MTGWHAPSPVVSHPLWRFAMGLRAHDQALKDCLRLPGSNGPAEGRINRLKMVKRQTFGRSKLGLLTAS
jgi:transposase